MPCWTQLNARAAVGIGLYGKLPGLGDFVRRRLPGEFVAVWDNWLQRMVKCSREALAHDWLDAYLSAPIWRFALPAGICGSSAWVGVLVPSVDKVGRYFPLTLAINMPIDTDPVGTMFSAQRWFAALEQYGLAALNQRLDFNAFDERLGRIGAPDAMAAADAADDTLPIPSDKAICLHFADEQSAIGHAGEVLAAQTARGRPCCLWEAAAAEDEGGRVVMLAERLPLEAEFCAMLTGRWAEHGINKHSVAGALPSR
ncbi:MAG: type VI secretion system-associated protein TagF [Rhodocyclaceae bacterium]|nr:type VI secretion system-associated protein TagF [Rhodocyclaceae bacterium]MBX3668206.1 type VI secretion system-associated protein TagF [Rhodocyclaceae bacterium]